MTRLAALLSASALVSGLVSGQAAAPAEADPVVLTVGAEQITQSTFELIISTLTPQQQSQLQTPEARRQLGEQIVELKVMAQEGRRRRLDQDPGIQMDVILQAERVLARAAFEQVMAEPSDEALLRAYYDEHQNDYEQALGSHILIRHQGSQVPLREGQEDLTEAEALKKIFALQERIKAGEDFAEIAMTESDDQSSGANGGDLGTFRRGEMIEEFTDTAFSIPLGEVSNPIKTAYGYHLITIRERGFIPFEELRDEIEQLLVPEIGAQKVQSLKDETAVEFNDSYFGPAPPPSTTLTAPGIQQ